MGRDVKEIMRQLNELNRPVSEAEEGPLASLTIELPVRLVARLQAVADRLDASFEEAVVMCVRNGLTSIEVEDVESEDGDSPF